MQVRAGRKRQEQVIRRDLREMMDARVLAWPCAVVRMAKPRRGILGEGVGQRGGPWGRSRAGGGGKAEGRMEVGELWLEGGMVIWGDLWQPGRRVPGRPGGPGGSAWPTGSEAAQHVEQPCPGALEVGDV